MDTVKHLDRETLFSISFLVPTGTILWVLYWLTIFLYRAYFSPLSHIPGPRLAAATFWYEFYYEIYPHKFQYLWKIKQLHEQYGPIVRINPIHVHIHDHDYFDTIYAAGNRKRNRCSWYMHTGSKNIGGGLVEAIDHDTHRMKRKAAEPFFSKRSVQALEGAIVAKVEKLLARFSSALTESRGKGEQGAIVNLSDAMGALTLDVISDYSFGEPMGALEKDDYGHDFVKMLHDSVQLRPLGRQFPTVVNAMFDMPVWLATRLNSQFSGMVEWMDSVVHLIDDVKAEHAGVKKSRSQGSRNIFHEILEKDLPPEEKETQILLGSAMNFLGAGTETTARTLAVTSYYVLNDRDILDRLRKELKGVMPTRNSKPSLPQLEALPFLSAVINEGLRCAHGVSARQPRIPTDEELIYRQYTIPKGTPLMESLYLLHTDPKVFPEPLKFRPERWIENPKLTKYQLAFSKGAMGCLGMNLATSELYLATAYLMRWMELEIYDTKEERDVLTIYDCFLGMTDLSSEGIKVRILDELTA